MSTFYAIYPAGAAGGGGSTAITSINGDITPSQLIVAASTGTDFSIATASGITTIALPSASATARGVVTTGTQTFAGQKTFSTGITGDLTGNASGSAGSFTGSLVGDVTGTQGATVLSATTNGTLTTLSALTTASALASVGTITSGIWGGTTIAIAHGGTGATSATGSGNVVLATSPTISGLTCTGITTFPGTSSIDGSGNTTIGGTFSVGGALSSNLFSGTTYSSSQISEIKNASEANTTWYSADGTKNQRFKLFTNAASSTYGIQTAYSSADFNFVIQSNTANAFTLTPAGNLSIGGSLTLPSSQGSTGSTTVTFAATNAPSFSTPAHPSIWMAVNIGGTVYYFPGWN